MARRIRPSRAALAAVGRAIHEEQQAATAAQQAATTTHMVLISTGDGYGATFPFMNVQDAQAKYNRELAQVQDPHSIVQGVQLVALAGIDPTHPVVYPVRGTHVLQEATGTWAPRKA